MARPIFMDFRPLLDQPPNVVHVHYEQWPPPVELPPPEDMKPEDFLAPQWMNHLIDWSIKDTIYYSEIKNWKEGDWVVLKGILACHFSLQESLSLSLSLSMYIYNIYPSSPSLF